MNEPTTKVIDNIKASWNQDAFMINDAVLIKKCKEWAAQQIALAKELGQDWDVSPEKLVALYIRQRGKCDESGVPMTYASGERSPTKINLDHIVEVLRGRSRLSRCDGGSALGGQAGMMSNIRFVCQHVHQLKAKIHNALGDFGDLLPRLAVRYMEGPPCNQSIDIEKTDQIAFGATHARAILEEWSKDWTSRPTAKQLQARLACSGIDVESHFVVRFIREKFGCDCRSSEQRHRVEVAAEFLINSPRILGLMSAGSRSHFSEAMPGLSQALMDYGCHQVSSDAMREDIAIAYELVTGKKSPTLNGICKSQNYVRQKLDSWSKPTPVMRSLVLRLVQDAGDQGISIDFIVDRVMEVQVVGSVDHQGLFRKRIEESVGMLCGDLIERRMADLVDGVVVGRLSIDEAASRCGYASSYMNKCHKIGDGPDCEYARPGKGRIITFSRRDVDKWMDARKARARVCFQPGPLHQQSLFAS